MIQLLRNERGFTLIELLVSVTLLTVGLLAVAGMQTVALNKGGISAKSSAATSLAHEAMDDIMSWGIAKAQLNSSSTAVYANNVSVQGGGIFNVTYTTTTDTPQVGTTKVVVTVRVAGDSIPPVRVASFKKVV